MGEDGQDGKRRTNVMDSVDRLRGSSNGFTVGNARNAALKVGRVLSPALGVSMAVKHRLEEAIPKAAARVFQEGDGLKGLAEKGLKKAGVITSASEAGKRVNEVTK